MSELTIRALGRPAPQGSKTFKGMRGGKPVMAEASAALPAWRKAVTEAAVSAMTAAAWTTVAGPVEALVTVFLARPKSVRRPSPCVAPDLDKIVRACLDSLTDAKVWEDDGQVVRLVASKRYADANPPGVRIVVTALDPQGALL